MREKSIILPEHPHVFKARPHISIQSMLIIIFFIVLALYRSCSEFLPSMQFSSDMPQILSWCIKLFIDNNASHFLPL